MKIRLIIISVICIIAQLPVVQSWLLWDKSAIYTGQVWRILTGNFSHTNLMHLAMNLVALWILAFIFRPKASQVTWLILVISLIIGLLLLLTKIEWYVGLSGTLHGLFAYWSLNEALNGKKSSWTLVVGVIAKVAWESVYGASEATAMMINANVATEAHLIGTIIGLMIATIVMISQWLPIHPHSEKPK